MIGEIIDGELIVNPTLQFGRGGPGGWIILNEPEVALGEQIYARHTVGHIWLIDPSAMTMDVFKLADDKWVQLGSFAENDKVRAEPFQEIEINLGDLWLAAGAAAGWPSP